MSAAIASSQLEDLTHAFQKSARQDGFKFLNIGDVKWKPAAERVVALGTSQATLPLGSALISKKLPAEFASDPFAQFALWSGNIHEINLSADDEKRLYLTANPEGTESFASRLTVVRLAENSRLELVYFQEGTEQLFSRLSFVLEKNAQLKLTLIQNGVSKGQIRAHIECQGENAEARIHGLTVGKNTERQDLWVDVVHAVPHTRSDLVAWCIVKDQAHSVFNGKMTIAQTAPFTEAFQKNKNLILTDGASVDTFPKLFILNNEVKCAHGSTVSSLEPDQLVYLQSRGIDRATAERMLQKGFIRQAIEWIVSDETRKKVETALLGTSENEESNDELEWGSA